MPRKTSKKGADFSTPTELSSVYHIRGFFVTSYFSFHHSSELEQVDNTTRCGFLIERKAVPHL